MVKLAVLFTFKMLVWELWFCKNFNRKPACGYWGLAIVAHGCLGSSFFTSQARQMGTDTHTLPDLLLFQIHLSVSLFPALLSAQPSSFPLGSLLLRDCPITVFFASASCCLFMHVYSISNNYEDVVCVYSMQVVCLLLGIKMSNVFSSCSWSSFLLSTCSKTKSWAP